MIAPHSALVVRCDIFAGLGVGEYDGLPQPLPILTRWASVTLARMSATSRRQFLEQCAGAAAWAWLLPELAHAATPSAPDVKFPSAARDRVAVAAYPFREFIVGWKAEDGKTPSP